ncbi:Dyp-type peroxidase [Paraburkholderia sp. J41]|uniref:Dyp-type peroxidase n=1 Tax=Paraburkholderia sp. J41 TaxID=2805433 RepID=UPI002AC35C23|nr:Dyp-type peroxidase [Paraburkholderia sp. J41]
MSQKTAFNVTSQACPLSGLQSIDAPLSSAAAFLVLNVKEDERALSQVRSVIAHNTDDLVKGIRLRSNTGLFTCNVGISHRIWTPLTRKPMPAELRPFQEVRGAKHVAVATPGDLLYHIRAESMDLIVEFEKLLLEAFALSVTAVDDVAGFRYFDGRDLLEFVDGTGNPDGDELPDSTLVGSEDPDHAGGSYVVVQKYVHDLNAWRSQQIETQEQIIGRTKYDNVELPDSTDSQKSHKSLCTIVDAEGEHDILRDNMPFAVPGMGQFGTYFVGYSRHLWVIEKMLQRMFIGDPPPFHDRILDFSKAMTGNTFFVPSRSFLMGLGD